MNSAYLIAATAALCLAGCDESTKTTTPQTLSFMSQQELLAAIPGETLYGKSSQDNNTKWVQVYTKGGKSGKISGLWGKEPYTSTWFVKDNMWCEKSDMFDACFTAVRVGEGSLQMYQDGTKKLSNLWHIR